MKDERERDVEKYLVKQITKCGGKCLKWRAVDTGGVPDRICMLPWMGIFFVEVKAIDGKLSKKQRHMFGEFREAGGATFIACGKAGVDELIKYVEGLKE